MAQPAYRTPPEEQDLTTKVQTHVEVDWPRSLGFFGAIGAAVALELVPVPIALFIASVPFLKLMNRPNASAPERFVGQVVDGAAKPVGGDSEGTIHWSSNNGGPASRSKRSKGRTGGARRGRR